VIPAGTHEGGSNEFGADVPFAEFLLFQSIHSVILIFCDNLLIPFYVYLHYKSRNVLIVQIISFQFRIFTQTLRKNFQSRSRPCLKTTRRSIKP
jgi:hypothetical protein